MDGIERCLASAVICRCLTLGFHAPAAQTVQALLSHSGRRALRRAAQAVGRDGGTDLCEAIFTLCALSAAPLADLERRRAELFGHTLRGKVSPYETEYGGGAPFQQAQDLADISGYYAAFGLETRHGDGERLDHAGCELEFLGFLCLKEAYAIEREDAAMLEVTRGAARGFLRDHLGRFGPAFGRAVAREDPAGFLGALGRICAALVELECGRLGVPLGPETLELRPEQDDGAPMACGSACDPSLLQIGQRG